MFNPRKKLQTTLSLSSKLFLKTFIADIKRSVSAIAVLPTVIADRALNILAPKLATKKQTLAHPTFDESDLPAAAKALALETAVIQPAKVLVSVIIPVFNKAAFTLQCVRSVLGEVDRSSTEIIVVNNASTDSTPTILDALGSHVYAIHNIENLGFVDACNEGAAKARGRFLVFLNNDTVVLPGWLKHLAETIEANPEIGAVGSLFLYPDGKIQEAGSIVWRNGDAHHYGWSNSPDDRRFNFAREVDYCSAASLLIRKEIFEQLGGFDRRFAPAYYEDVDLCFGVRSLGYKIIYQPMSRLVHFEGVTAGRDTTKSFKQYQITNRLKFVEKWHEVLNKEHFNKDLKHVVKAAHRKLGPCVVVFDERIPSPDRDAGSARMSMILKALTNWAHVIFVPFNRPQGIEYEERLWKVGIETADIVDYRRLLKKRRVKAVIVSRPSVAEAMIARVRRLDSRIPIVFDMVDAHFIRLQREAELSGDVRIAQSARRYHKLERRLARSSDLIWCNSSEDKRVMRIEAPGKRIEVIPTIHALHDRGKPFAKRCDLLFVGNLAHAPNSDAVRFFVGEIFPRVKKSLAEVKVRIVGDFASAELLAYASADVLLTGYLADLESLFHGSRVFIAPLRFGAGVKGKIGEAMSYALPVVTTPIGAEGFGLVNESNAMIADTPDTFADAVVRLYSDEDLWRRLAQNSWQHIAENFTPEIIAETINSSIKEVAD